MNINLEEKKNENLDEDVIIVELQYSSKNKDFLEFIEYIKKYEQKNKVIVLDNNYTLIEIQMKDIILFYSDKKVNYCKTQKGSYKVKSTLYELEKISNDFIRISKSCIVNINHIEKFDISETGKIVVKLDDFTEQIVSRRRTGEIMKYLEERRI